MSFLFRAGRLGAIAVSAALVLSACGSELEGESGPLADITVTSKKKESPSATGVSASPSTAPSAGEESADNAGDDEVPVVELEPKPLELTESEIRVLTEGDGPEVSATDLTSLNIQLIQGTDGEVLDDTWSAGQPIGFDLSSENTLAVFKDNLPKRKVGARLLVGAPVKEIFGAETGPDFPLKADDTVLLLLEIVATNTPAEEATGKSVEPKDGLPTVEVTKGKAATFTMPKAEPPKELIAQPLITGEGEKVEQGQTVKIAYTGALWKNGEVFDSAPDFTTTIGVGQVVPGWDKSIVGASVGSRLLLVVPPSEGYGEQGSGDKITGTDTMVFVVDILGAV